MNDIPKQLMAGYGWIIQQFVGIPDETMDATVQRRLEEAPALALVDFDGVPGVKPESANKDSFEDQRLPLLFQETLKGSLSALYHTALHPFRLEREDADIAHLLNDSYFGRLITEEPGGQPLIDLGHYEHLKTLPGFYCHGIKAFLRREDGALALDRIEISGQTIPRGHRSWELAKIHLLVAMDNETLFGDHSVVHLNNNFIESAAKRMLSPKNPLRLFLAPHFGFTIPLDELIMELFYKHTNPGNPFAFPARSIFALIGRGLRADHARGLAPVLADTRYNRALGESHGVIAEHVAEFVARNLRVDSPEFAEIRACVDAARESIPYLPRGADLDLDAVTAIVARFMHEASFVSSTDHIVTKSGLGYFRSIFRIRRPFVAGAPWQMADLFRPIDTYQRIVFRNVFSGDKCATLLRDVDYDPSLSLSPTRFRGRLRDLERRHPAIFPLDRIAASIDI